MAQGFLDQWLICGPFFSDRGWATLDEDYLFGEARVAPRLGTRSFGREWIEFDTTDGFLQFLNAPFEHTLFCAGYAHTYVHAPRDMDAVLLLGSDDGIKVWLNGEVVWRNDVNRAAVAGDDRASVRLRAGWNSLLVKVRQGMSHWQFCAQLVGSDKEEIPGLACAREADWTGPGIPPRAVGVRVRFVAETYEPVDGAFHRYTQLEVGCIGTAKCGDVRVEVEGASPLSVGPLEPGETRIISAKLPFDSVLSAMRGAITARDGGNPVETTVTVSDSCRLLRDLFAPFFVPQAASADLPAVLRGFGWSQLAVDGKGRYMLVDPPELRKHLAGLVAAFPMADAAATAAGSVCNELLRLALAGECDKLMWALGNARLPGQEGKA